MSTRRKNPTSTSTSNFGVDYRENHDVSAFDRRFRAPDLSADVITILEDLGLLLRGELIWQKAQGATGSCAWGSFRSASNPVLRDLTERVIVASKGRLDWALGRAHALWGAAVRAIPGFWTKAELDRA